MSKPRAITELISGHFEGTLEETILRGKKLHKLSRLIQNLLDPQLAAHCHLQNLRQGSLIIACDSTVWATRLRYQSTALLTMLHQQAGLKDIRDIQIRVQPAAHPRQRAPRRQARLSSDASYCIEQCAKTISDPALRQALAKLAKNKRD